MESITREDKIKFLTELIEKENMLNGEAVGFAGEKTDQYIHFEELMSIASKEDLLSLTIHKNAVVRCYAIWALSKLKYYNLLEVIKEHIYDIEVVETFFCCRLGIKTVIDFCLTYCDLTKEEKALLIQMYELNPNIKILAKENIDKLKEQLKSKYFKD